MRDISLRGLLGHILNAEIFIEERAYHVISHVFPALNLQMILRILVYVIRASEYQILRAF